MTQHAARALHSPRAMRFGALLLVLLLVLSASVPCAPSAGVDREFMSGSAAIHAHTASAGGAPCHEPETALFLRALCPCGCDDQAPGAASLGALGVALMSGSQDLWLPARAGCGELRLQRAAAGDPSAIEKVPRSA